jgi:hypothetical protein
LLAWQKRRVAAIRSAIAAASGHSLGVHDLARMLGWDQTRAYEATRDLGDVSAVRGTTPSRIWPRLRALDELCALDELELELVGTASVHPPPLHLFLAFAVPHLAALDLSALLGDLATDEIHAIAAWLVGRRKDAAVRALGRQRIAALVADALPRVHGVAWREYQAIVADCSHHRR